MKWSLKLGSVKGISIYLHWTFALLILWIFMSHLNAGQSASQAMAAVGFILALFTCVVLHEFGHAFTALHYGIHTRDITLLPIGGVARLESIPQNPAQEFWVSLAGPAVNGAIIVAILILLSLSGGIHRLAENDWLKTGFLERLMWVNLFIGTFNLLPAFPMDGGRILRAILASRIGRPRATRIAATTGQAMAILFGIIGFMSNPFLVFIGIFVYLGAQSEASQVKIESTLEGLKVRDAMITKYRTLSAQDTLATAVEELLAGSQQDFPVCNNEQMLGLLRRNELVQALHDGRQESTISEVMKSEWNPVDQFDDLTRTLESMTSLQCSTLPVTGNGKMVGLLTLENIGELILINSALSENHLTRKKMQS
ncbi:MAG: site-2 protease family protein [Akkermansiaceae bacterium]|jgi:Zn-dependent protease|nr:site-2 protease family protein [Akkermansiaceae bacterium]